MWLVATLLPSLSLFFDSDLSSGLICCCTMSLWYVDVLCLATWFVAISPALRSPACSRCASYCGFSSPMWCTTFAMGSHLRGRGCCGPRSERRFGLFLFPFWADSSRWNHPLGRHCFRSHSRSERSLFCISLGVVQDLHGGLPNSGVKLDVASVPVRPGGLIFCHSTTVLHAEVTLWIKCVSQFPLLHDRRLSLLLGPLILPNGLQASICDFSSRHVTAGVFPGGPR